MFVRAAAMAADDVPSPEKRGLMNLLLAGAVGLPVSSASTFSTLDPSLSRIFLILIFVFNL